MAYLFQVNLYLLLVYGFYWLLLRNETFHQQNRIILLGGICMSLLIPLMPSDYLINLITPQAQPNLKALAGIKLISMKIGDVAQTRLPSWQTLLVLTYGLGVGIMFIRLIVNALNLRKLLADGLGGRAFSFLSTIYVDTSHPQQEVIQQHENVHARQLHSLDLIFLELLLVFNWFNPVLYLVRQALKNLHEYIADEAASQLIGKASYARLLLSEHFDVSDKVFVSSFYQFSTLKKRIIMLAKEKSAKKALFKYGFSLPVFGIMILVSSSFIQEKVYQNQSIKQIDKAIDEVVNLSAPASSKQSTKLATTKVNEEAISLDEALAEVAPENSELSTMDSVSTKNPPLCVVDGKYMAYEHISILDASKIERMSVVKGAEALKKYGERGKNGVIEIFTNPYKKDLPPVLPLKGVHLTTNEGSFYLDAEGSDAVFSKVEQPAEFVGGNNAMSAFMAQKMVYPPAARRAMVTGSVLVSFVINIDGSVSDSKIVKSIGFGCDEEALRLIESMPAWKPAKQAGHLVKQSFIVPVEFK